MASLYLNKLTPDERELYEQLLTLNLDAAQISQTLGLQVVNDSHEKRYFSAILWGCGVD